MTTSSSITPYGMSHRLPMRKCLSWDGMEKYTAEYGALEATLMTVGGMSENEDFPKIFEYEHIFWAPGWALGSSEGYVPIIIPLRNTPC